MGTVGSRQRRYPRPGPNVFGREPISALVPDEARRRYDGDRIAHRRLDLFFLDRDSGQLEDNPIMTILCKEAAGVIVVQTLHHDDDRAFCLVIQPRADGIFEPAIDVLVLGVRGSVRLFERIINDDNIAATAG